MAGLDLLRRKKVSGKRLVMYLALLTTRALHKVIRRTHSTILSDNDRLAEGKKSRIMPRTRNAQYPTSPTGRTPQVWAVAYDWLLCVGGTSKSPGGDYSVKWHLHSTQNLCHRVLEATLEH